MKTFIADIIPKIQRFSKKLDDLTKLTNQHWVSLGDINQNKKVFIFRQNNQLLISENGIVEKGSWEYLGNQSLLIETQKQAYLLKHGFFDENVIALKLDSTDSYAFFVNETKYDSELNNIDDIIQFLSKKYLTTNSETDTLGTHKSGSLNSEENKYTYKILEEVDSYDFVWGHYKILTVEFSTGKKGSLYKGRKSGKFFCLNSHAVMAYYENIEQAIKSLFIYVSRFGNQ